MNNMDIITGYFDYNATTPISDSVMDKMKESMHVFCNASSSNSAAQVGKDLLSNARQSVASLLDCDSSNIAFTSGGSEANNWAIKSYLMKFLSEPGHVITSAIEHPSVLDTLKYLENTFGFKITYLSPTKDGSISVESVRDAIRTNTKLISIMYANNETGALQPVSEIVTLAKEFGIKVHVDGVQIIGKRAVSVRDLGVDFMSFSAHKYYGPKGIGGLYLRNPEDVEPLIHGGGQEMGLRAGTENLVAIAGLAQASDDCSRFVNQWDHHYTECKKHLLNKLTQSGIQFCVNGTTDVTHSVANTVNISLTGIRGEALAAFLDKKFGIAVSIGSACSNNKTKKLSHVLKSMGLEDDRIQSALRISFGRYTTLDGIDYFIDSLSHCSRKLLEFGKIA